MNPSPDFTLFGIHHLATLAVVLFLAFLFGWLGKKIRSVHTVARAMAFILVGVETAKLVILIGVSGYPWHLNLPLDICRINVFVCATMLIFRNYRFFEVAYFWSMAGSTGAMLTPDLPVGFPHPMYLMFFLGHGMLVWAVIFVIPGFGFRPRWGSIGRAIAVTSLYAALIAVLNRLLDANYLYLSEPPPAATILNVLGSGFAYYTGLFGLVVVACLVCYAPFAFADLRREARSSQIRGQ